MVRARPSAQAYCRSCHSFARRQDLLHRHDRQPLCAGAPMRIPQAPLPESTSSANPGSTPANACTVVHLSASPARRRFSRSIAKFPRSGSTATIATGSSSRAKATALSPIFAPRSIKRMGAFRGTALASAAYAVHKNLLEHFSVRRVLPQNNRCSFAHAIFRDSPLRDARRSREVPHRHQIKPVT